MTTKRWTALLLVLAMLVPGPASAGVIEDAVASTRHTPDELVATFDDAILPGLGSIAPAPGITSSAELDDRIRMIAEARGYRRRPEPTQPLVAIDGFRLQPDAATAWGALRAAASAAGHPISLTSGYRSTTTQAALFRRRLAGTSDGALDVLLRTAAPPGYSRHHTGYAIDIRTPTKVLHDFATSEAYAWLSADDWAVAKSFGWVPSYPDGAGPGGPDPEPWEFVWVGSTNIICGDFEVAPGDPFCDTLGSTFAADIDWLFDNGITTGCATQRFCQDDEITRAQAATMLWRMADSPESTTTISFVDVPDDRYYTAAVRWMVELSITTGTSATEFSPDARLTRDQFVTFLWRFAGRPQPATPHGFDDVMAKSFAADAVSWAAESGITTGTSSSTFSPAGTATRGQAAAFLHRFDLLALKSSALASLHEL